MERIKTPISQKDFIRAIARHERSIRSFVRAGLPRPGDVDEVMQEVLIVAWEKIDQLESVEDFPRWVCAISRFQILAFRRKHARDRLIFSEEVLALLAEEGLAEDRLRVTRLELLETCMKRLPASKRNLILRAYSPEIRIRELAAENSKSENAIHLLLRRIRLTLRSCIETNFVAEQFNT